MSVNDAKEPMSDKNDLKYEKQKTNQRKKNQEAEK